MPSRGRQWAPPRRLAAGGVPSWWRALTAAPRGCWGAPARAPPPHSAAAGGLHRPRCCCAWGARLSQQRWAGLAAAAARRRQPQWQGLACPGRWERRQRQRPPRRLLPSAAETPRAARREAGRGAWCVGGGRRAAAAGWRRPNGGGAWQQGAIAPTCVHTPCAGPQRRAQPWWRLSSYPSCLHLQAPGAPGSSVHAVPATVHCENAAWSVRGAS